MPMLVERAVALYLYGMHAACKPLAHIVSINQVHDELLKSLRVDRACWIGSCAEFISSLCLSRYRGTSPSRHKAVQRALKTGGLVFLKAEMSHPRKAITAEQAVLQVLRFASRYQHDQACKTETGANEMQATAGLVAVLSQVKRIKLQKTFKGFWV